MSTRRDLLTLGLALGLLWVPAVGLAASSAEPSKKKPFIDRDGDGIRDGEEDRFRSRRDRRRRGRGKQDGAGDARQRRERGRKGKEG